MAKVGDEFIFHSKDGMDYSIEIVNVNDYREPSMRYGADVYDCNGAYAGDVMFFGDDFLRECKEVE